MFNHHQLSRRFCQVFTLLILSYPIGASTIVIVWQPSKVFIASDSKILATGPNHAVVGTFRQCKVHSTADRFVTAAVGVLQMTHQWNIWSVLDGVTKCAQSVEDAAVLSKDRLKSSFTPFARLYGGPLETGKSYLEWIIAGIRKDGQTVIFHGWIPATPDHRIEPSGELSVLTKTRTVGYLCLGKCDEILQYWQSEPNWFMGREDLGETAKSFVQREIVARPAEVGGPVALVVISKTGGVEWRSCALCEAAASCKSESGKN